MYWSQCDDDDDDDDEMAGYWTGELTGVKYSRQKRYV